MRRGYRSAVVVSVLFCVVALSLPAAAQGSAADLLVELASGDSNRCMEASNATSEHQEHYQTMAAELALPLVTIVESEAGCADNAVSALLNLGPGIVDGAPAARTIPALMSIVDRALEPNAPYELVSTASTAILIVGYYGEEAGAAATGVQRWVAEAPDYHHRSYGVDTLSRMGDAAAPVVPAILPLLDPPAADDENAWEKNELRASVVRMLGSIPAAIDSSGPVLIATLRGGEESFPYLAAESLTAIGAPAAPYLIGALEDESPEIRAQVLEILTALGPAAADGAPVIAALMRDDDWNVSYQAAETMRQIGPTPEGIAALVEILESGDQDAASASAEILGSYGSRGSAALPALRNAAQSNDWMISDAAKGAIAAIEGGE